MGETVQQGGNAGGVGKDGIPYQQPNSEALFFSAKLGAYSRSGKLTTEDFEMLVVAEK